MNFLRRMCCPVCGATTAAARAAVRSSPPAENLTPDRHEAVLSGCGRRRSFFTYFRCWECGGLYCPVYYTGAQLATFYGHRPPNMHKVPLADRQKTQRGYFEILAPYVNREGDYLEVGPDIGLFAHICAEAIAFARFFLFEPNRNVHAAVRARLSRWGICLAPEPFRDGMVPRGTIGTAVLIHVLDHVIDPRALLAALHAALRSDGTLFLVVHDERSLLARILGRHWPPYTAQHPQLFSRGSVTGLLRRCGFTVLEVRKTWNRLPLGYLLRVALKAAGFGFVASSGRNLLAIRLKLGNIAVVARKDGLSRRSGHVDP